MNDGGRDMPRYAAPKPNPEHWSKDFVEHLRVVHFTLVTVSVGLIALLSSKTYDARKAAVEMNELAELTSRPLLVAPTLKSTKASSDEIPYSKMFEATVKGETYQFYVDEPNLYQCGKALRTLDPSSLHPHTISSVQAIIDSWSYAPLFSIQTIRRAGTIKNSGGKTEPLVITRSLAAINSDSGANLRLSVDCASGSVKGLMDGIVDYGENKPPTFQFSITVGLQEQHLDKALAWAGLGFFSFQSRYRNLVEATRGRENLDFSILAPQIYAEVEKGDEPFEAFGLKIPGNRIAVWGIVVLVSVQLYFVMYLRRLSNKLQPDDPGWDVPWMAMDESKFARAMLFVSVVLLPAGATFVVIAREMRAGSSRSEDIEGNIVMCGFLLSWVLDLLSWRYRPKLREPSVPSQLFE